MPIRKFQSLHQIIELNLENKVKVVWKWMFLFEIYLRDTWLTRLILSVGTFTTKEYNYAAIECNSQNKLFIKMKGYLIMIGQ